MGLFQKAKRTESRLRMALLGPAGSGKTFTALRIAHGLLEPGKRIAFIDTEHASSTLYADETNPDGGTLEFDVLDLASMEGRGYSVEKYIRAIRAAGQEGYPLLIIDSLSHAWAGEGGVLDFVNEQSSRSRNSFAAWRKGTPLHNSLVEALLNYPGHVIVTMRTKVEYVQEKDDKGRTEIRKVGLQPVQREGLDYEFDVVADIDVDSHTMVVGKTRCSRLADRSFHKAGGEVADILKGWLSSAEAAPEPQPEPEPEPQPEQVRPEDAPPHQSFKAHQGWFFAQLNDHGVDYDDLKAACLDKGWGKPSTWTRKKREGLINSFDDGSAWEKLGLQRPELPPEPEHPIN